MTLVTDFKARMAPPAVDGLLGVDEAADLAALIAAKQLPQRSPWAYVLPIGFDGGAPDAAAGLYRQPFNSVIAVVLVIQALDDPKARAALATIDGLQQLLLARICGWAPASAIGVFRALRGRLVSVASGLVIYQIDFALQDQLRIAT